MNPQEEIENAQDESPEKLREALKNAAPGSEGVVDKMSPEELFLAGRRTVALARIMTPQPPVPVRMVTPYRALSVAIAFGLAGLAGFSAAGYVSAIPPWIWIATLAIGAACSIVRSYTEEVRESWANGYAHHLERQLVGILLSQGVDPDSLPPRLQCHVPDDW